MSDIHIGSEFAAAASTESEWFEAVPVQDVDGMSCKIEYGTNTELYRVTVALNDNELVSYIEAGYRPIFGIDVSDAAKIGQVSESMAVKLENN